MNYSTTIPLPQEYNWALVPLNLFAPSTIISNRVHPRDSHRIRYYRIHCYWSHRITNSSLQRPLLHHQQYGLEPHSSSPCWYYIYSNHERNPVEK
jgi:hypothetical protein